MRIGRQIVCKDLSRPIPFKVPFSIYPYYPDDSLPVISAKLVKLGRQHARIFRRRGGGPIADTSRDRRKLTILFEDLASIKTILVSAWPHDDGTYVAITRTSVWVYAVSDEAQILLIETDITHKKGEICETETCYGQLIIPSSYAIQDVRGSGSIHGEENDSKICIRLPYSKLDSKAPTFDLSRFDMPEEIMDSAVISSLEIQCSFCCASLFSQGSINKSQDLPSGMLDHVSDLYISIYCVLEVLLYLTKKILLDYPRPNMLRKSLSSPCCERYVLYARKGFRGADLFNVKSK